MVKSQEAHHDLMCMVMILVGEDLLQCGLVLATESSDLCKNIRACLDPQIKITTK